MMIKNHSINLIKSREQYVHVPNIQICEVSLNTLDIIISIWKQNVINLIIIVNYLFLQWNEFWYW
jgi:hypothetical protein